MIPAVRPTARHFVRAHRLPAAAWLCGLGAPGAACATMGEGPVTGEVSGYAESRHQGVLGLDPDFADLAAVFPDGYHPENRYGAIERLRPTLKLHVGQDATLVATGEARTAHGFFDTNQTELGDVVSVERFYLTATAEDWDHTAGKQNIVWGSGLLLNPTDLFNDKNPADLQAERPGLWALKSLWAVNDHTNLTFVAAMTEETCCAATVISRFDTTLDNTDLAVEAAWDAGREVGIVGVDVRTELTVGLWLEAAATVPKNSPSDTTTSVEAGLDYSFDVLQALYLAGEYMYQQSGLERPGEQFDLANLQASATAGSSPEAAFAESFRNRRMFMGRHYGVAVIRLEIGSDWRAQLVNVTHLGDRTGLVVPQVSWLPAEAWTLTLGAQVTYGESGGEYTMTLPELTPPQEQFISAASPTLGPALVSLQGARLTPAASVFLWGRYAW